MLLEADIFKANDIRGVITGAHPQWDLEGAHALGGAFVRLLGLAGHEFVLGRDMRVRGRELSLAFSQGARDAGANVVDIGLSSTDELWFASGWLSIPGVQFTASHNPASYNGIKFCLADAAPVSSDFIQKLAAEALRGGEDSDTRGSYREIDALDAYASYLRSLVPIEDQRRLKIVVDAGNGMAGHTVDTVFDGLNVEIIGLYLDLDGTFPNHPANPLEPENLVPAQKAVLEHGADLALVFDGDADRCFIIDEQANVVDPSVVTALIATAELAKEPGATIVMNTITSETVKNVVTAQGGTIIASKVGHTYMKALMAAHNAVFGGEHSAHYYFRDFWGADTGMLAALHVVAMLAKTQKKLSELVSSYDVYCRSGELNSVVDDAAGLQKKVAEVFADRGVVDLSDGLTIRCEQAGQLVWWLSLRASNTEPLLRLNVEACDHETMTHVRDEVLALIKEHR